MDSKPTVLVVDEREHDRTLVQEYLEAVGLETHGIHCPEQIKDAITSIHPDLIIIRVAFASDRGHADEIETYAQLMIDGLLDNINIIFTTLRTDSNCLNKIEWTGKPLFNLLGDPSDLVKLVKKKLGIK